VPYIIFPKKKSAFPAAGSFTEGAFSFAKGHDGREKDSGGGSGDSGGVPGAAVDCGVYCGSNEPSGAQGKASPYERGDFCPGWMVGWRGQGEDQSLARVGGEKGFCG